MAEGGRSAEENSNCQADDDDDEFEDAVECPSELEQSSFHDIIEDAVAAMDLFLNNSFVEARLHFQKWAHKSMYHALGYGTIMYLQAAMTFEAADIEEAIEVVKQSMEVCNRFRKKTKFVEAFYKQKSYYDDLTAEEVHAELCYAECLLERAFLTFIQDENLINFIKGSLKVKACYSSYKECIKIFSKRTWKTNDEKTHFESGICLGVGAFNLMVSLMPSRIMKLLEFVGFSGSKRKGLQQLEQGAQLHHSLREPLCAFALIAYHSIITYFLGTGEGDVEYAAKLLQQMLVRYPKGAIFLFYAGRLNEVQGNIDEAIVKLEESVESQREWRQLHHFCFWELMWCHCYKGDWLLAMKYAEKLLEESKWSKSTYAYLKASFLLMCDEQTEAVENHIAELLQLVPKLKQRIAGKSLPMEKFAVKKSELFFEQGKRLTLPAYELFYVWNGFLILSNCPQLLEPILVKTQDTLNEMTSNKEKYIHYVDDYCLAMLIRGVCLKNSGQNQSAEECFQYIVHHNKDLQVDKYLAPCAHYELGMMYMSLGQYEKAQEALDMAKNDYKGYSLESRIHFRLHAATMKLNSLRKEGDSSPSLQSLDVPANDDDAPAV